MSTCVRISVALLLTYLRLAGLDCFGRPSAIKFTNRENRKSLACLLPHAPYSLPRYRCHVMERESFESEEVAQILNSSFISIKVRGWAPRASGECGRSALPTLA